MKKYLFIHLHVVLDEVVRGAEGVDDVGPENFPCRLTFEGGPAVGERLVQGVFSRVLVRLGVYSSFDIDGVRRLKRARHEFDQRCVGCEFTRRANPLRDNPQVRHWTGKDRCWIIKVRLGCLLTRSSAF